MTILRRFGALVLLVCCISAPASAQSRSTVSGVVADTSRAPIRGATVVALSLPDSVIAKFAITGNDGRFALRRVAAGDYVLQVTYVGFRTIRQNMILAGEDVDVGTLIFEEAVLQVDELVVTSDHIPIVVKRDTLEYNAAAFGVRANDNVEDLLRRLPGVEVRDDGSIRAQGEDVQNVLVDGKEFFGGDPTIATKNLPANAVDRVQVYDKLSDMAEFTGVEDGLDEKTINLALREDAKQGFFGQMSGGYGDPERYDAQASVNRFTPRSQLSVIANVNNVNRQGFSPGDYVQFMGGLRGLMSGGAVRLGGDIPLGTNLSDGFSDTFALGLNASRDFGERTSIRSSYFVSRIDNLQDRTALQRQVLGAAASSLVDESSSQNSGNTAHRLNLNAEHELSDGQDLRFRGNLSVSSSSLSNGGLRETVDPAGLIQNKALTQYDTAGDNIGGRTSLTYRNRLSSNGAALVAEARLDLNDEDLAGALASTTTLYDLGDVVSYDELLQEQERLGRTLRQTQRLSLTQPFMRKRVVELMAERQQVSEDQTFQVYDDVAGTPVFNDLLSSGFDRTYTYYRGGFRLQQNTDDLSLSIGLEAQRSQLDGQVAGRPEEIANGYSHLLPSARLRYEIRQGMSLNLNYRTSTREPSMTELQPFVDNSDPLNVYVGNPELEPEYRHSVGTHFMYFDQFSFTNLFAFANATYTRNAIARSRTVFADEGLRQEVTSVNTDGDWTFNGSVDFGRPIRPLRAKFNVSNRAMYSRGLEFINAEENRTNILRNTVEGSIENRAKDVWDLRAGARYTFNRVDYSLNERLNQAYVNRTYFTDARVYIADVWELALGLDYRMYDADVFGAQDDVALLTASISRHFMDQRAEIQLVGTDLLDQNVGVNFTNGSTYVQEERITSLGRFIMLKLVYRLSATGRDRGPRGVMIHAVGD